MITYKIRDNLLLSYDQALFFYEGEIWERFYRGLCPDRFICIRKTIDQSRYTIEREISDGVIYNIRDEYTTNSKGGNSGKNLLEIFRKIFREKLNQKTS